MPRKNLRPHITYNKSLTEKARDLRQQPTPAEKQFWYVIREMPFSKTYAFNRQKPIGEYIVDFYCHELGLVVEIDGDTHSGPEAEARDQNRTEFLESKGLRVIRFTNHEVLNSIEGVIQILIRTLEEIKEEAP